MPTISLKRPSGGGAGRLRRLLASLRPPGPLSVQTGFPTSLADIVVKNHGRIRNTRKRRRAAAAAAEPQQMRELSVARDAAAPAPVRPGIGAVFSVRPGLLAVCGAAVALALVVICWSKQMVAAATLASVALSWIESVRSNRWRPETNAEVHLRGRVSPIREVADSPKSRRAGCESEPDNVGNDAASLWSADTSKPSANNNPKLKQSRRSLRKLLANKLRSGKTLRSTNSRHGGDACKHEHPETPGRLNADAAAVAATAEPTPPPPRRGRALPLPLLVPIILAGLVAGKIPALALAVLCVAFSSSVGRFPVPISGSAPIALRGSGKAGQ
ncbi:uncharacterized protein [Zea mays]|jgi:hypothetical protein|uniref:Uncharacterized protein n=1 Tax=Zea mays TaxID=4577 RepID=A0A1D6KGQ1_MAIZE|nr:uncharacterized protein LOC103645086 [Zea mays]ONM02253.1 hypothetical protein ZEAMMB73_Zm00001d031148 [Zea mays]|eukprot:XP_008666432.2 uncharacterized protein LOC103645086 [Zea mays]